MILLRLRPIGQPGNQSFSLFFSYFVFHLYLIFFVFYFLVFSHFDLILCRFGAGFFTNLRALQVSFLLFTGFSIVGCFLLIVDRFFAFLFLVICYSAFEHNRHCLTK